MMQQFALLVVLGSIASFISAGMTLRQAWGYTEEVSYRQGVLVYTILRTAFYLVAVLIAAGSYTWGTLDALAFGMDVIQAKGL